MDSNIPKPPKGHQWKEVLHDNTVTWVASWHDSMSNEMVYVDVGFPTNDKALDLDQFELVYLNGPPWTNSTKSIVKKERISYQNAACLTLEFFQADPTSGIYKCIDCIPCQKNMMNIKKNGELYNVITSHLNEKSHAKYIRKPSKKRKTKKDENNRNPTSDHEIPAKLAAAQKRLENGSLALTSKLHRNMTEFIGFSTDLNPSLDEFEVVYLNGPPWPTNSTPDILKKERISYQNASCLPLDFFKADPTSGIYKCINCIPCQKIMMNITKKGQLQNVIVPHFNGKWHGIRCMGAQGFKQPNKRKLNSKGTNENPTSDDEPQIKRRKNKKHKHRKKEDEYYKNLSSQAMAYAQDQNEKNLPT